MDRRIHSYLIIIWSFLCIQLSAQETSCDDGIDNDSDGFIDHADSDCGNCNNFSMFDADPGWTGSLNTTLGSNFQWQNTNNTSGNPAGEIGGVFDRGSTQSGAYSRPYYTTSLGGTYTDDDDFHVSGEIYVQAPASAESFLIFCEAGDQDNHNFVGIHFNDQTGSTFRGSLTYADANNGTGNITAPCGGAPGNYERGVVLSAGANTPVGFEFDYDGTTRTLTGTINGNTIPSVTVPGTRNFTVDAFGLSMPACQGGSGSISVWYDALCVRVNGKVIQPFPEICGNGIDDNADGRIDEPFPGMVQDNLVLWLKADVGFTATTWTDQSTACNDATVFGDPTQVTNSLNFNTGINFDGDDHVEVYLPDLVFQSGNHSAAVFIVYQPSTSASTIGIFGNQSSTGLLGFQISNGNYGDGQALNALPVAFGTNPHMISYIVDEEDNVGGGTNESIINHNGGLVTSFTFDENNVNDVDDNLHIGLSGANASSQYFQGDIHEVIVYYESDGNAALVAAEIEQIESYLATKYGITMSQNYVDSQ